VRCLWGEQEQALVLLRWALQELTEQRRMEQGLRLLELRALELPRAWAVALAQTVWEQTVLTAQLL